jgi:prevent-host-death family protein
MATKPKVVPIGEFNQTCLRLLEEVRTTSHPLLVTKRGVPVALVVPPPPEEARTKWRGSMRDRGRVEGDIVSPALSADAWDALR